MSASALKRSLVSLPVIGKLFLIAGNIVRLPQTRQAHETELGKLNSSISKLSEQMTEAMEKFSNFQLTQDNLQKHIRLVESNANLSSGSKKGATASASSDLFASDHLLDAFYASFEDKFRGDEAMVEENLKVYLPYFKSSKVDYQKYPVLDIGSGRGELLRLLKSNKIPAVGLDINLEMVERSNKNGLDTKQGEAGTFLQDTKSQTYGAITGFHLVEHIPFGALLKIFKEAHRCLASNGFVIFETPNPENVIVGSHNFYLDPSHLHPLPPILLAYTLENCGFRKVEILRLHPDKEQDIKDIPPALANYFFGPRDYAVIGYK